MQKKLKKVRLELNGKITLKEINLKVRAFNPFPGAWTKIREIIKESKF